MSLEPAPAIRIAIVVALLGAGVACVSKSLDDPGPVSTIVIAPHTVVARDGQTVNFTVAVTNANNPDAFTCTVNASAVGLVTKTPTGCRLVVATPAAAGTLYARLVTLVDSATLTLPIANR
jgi:hypothetical protein